ncbi:hypothetical protein O7635_26585 [Asanoa sp. WMMD1127]|uniref:hypothetical protein n=1 Tax=Asanoa sp. WMMD1127 TaxID=3016107 RepID=UPI002417E6AE|nr:hypothetical protein [Asanoa sp. WMMD1127]MDG4825430.1 hypothetical protein [Asanoa sp. WMMD1127]
MRVRDVVDLAADEAPPPRYGVEDIVQRGRRVRRRRRQAWATSGAAGLAVLGVVAAVALQSRAVTGPAETAAQALTPVPVAAPPFTFTVDAYEVGRLRVAPPVDVATAYQIAPVYAEGLVTNDRAIDAAAPAREGPSLYAYLTVYRPGAYDPDKLPGARPVTVGERPGRETDVPEGGRLHTLAWEYADGAWAVIDSYSSEPGNPSAAEFRALAAGLRGTTPRPAKVPVTLGYVPAGYQLDEVAQHAMTGLNGIAAARDGDYGGLLYSRPAQPTTGLSEPYGGVEGADPPNSFVVYVVPSTNANQRPSRQISCGAGFCNRWSPDGKVNVQVASRGAGGLSTEEIRKVLDGITLADVTDDSTWKPVG